MRAMPDLAAVMLAQASSTVLPTGQTIPRPVTTTRRRDKRVPGAGSGLLAAMGLDVIDCLLDGGDLLGLLVRDLGLELLLERHNELDRVEGVGAEVIDERGFVLDLGLVDPELFGDDLLDAWFDVLHCGLPFPSRMCSRGRLTEGAAPPRASPFGTFLDLAAPSGRNLTRRHPRPPEGPKPPSTHVHATVYVERRAGHICGPGRCEKHHGRG